MSLNLKILESNTIKMLPHAELDNYKLQVELLQEKLKRSEQNREKLEHKLENALHKKTEQEKIVRAKQRQKYQEFVNELEKRNERNRQLKRMLERIDHQTSALSARSERLRMMKMQYEMYFAKLVQSQTMRCIQGTSNLAATPTSIPVLLPTTSPMPQQPSIIAATPIKNNEHDPTASNARAAATSSAIYQYDASGNLITAGSVPKPISYTLSPHCHIVREVPSCNIITPSPSAKATSVSGAAAAATAPPLPALTAGTQHWTLAMATPTPTGMLLTTTPTMPTMGMGVIPTTPAAAPTATNTAADFVSMPAYDYMQYPLGYLPRMRHLLQPKPSTPLYSDESDDLLQPMDANTKSDRYCRTNNTNKGNDRDNLYHKNDKNENSIWIDNNIGSLSQMDLPTRQLDNDKGIGVGVSVDLDVLAATEILRKDNENERQQQQQQERQKPEHLLSNVSTTSSATSLTLDKLPKTMTMTEHNTTAASSYAVNERNNDADDGGKPQLATRFDEASKDISSNIDYEYKDKGALMTQGNFERKSATDDSAATTPSTVITNDNENAIEKDLRRKIDNMMPSQQQQQQQQHMTQSWQKTENVVTSMKTAPDNKDNTWNNTEMTGGFTEYAENKVTNNGLNSGSDIKPTMITSQDNVTNSKMSIEKIENEIYGELVNPPTGETDKNDARNAAQGLLQELVTQQQEHQSSNEQIYTDILQNDDTTNFANYVENPPQNITAEYEQSNSEIYDPNYATIESTTAAEVYQQPNTELAYTDEQNASNNYAQYTADPNGLQTQQDYSNLDYANYDATQYSESAAYDPTAYPGYTYDATTGQYTPDPAQQYTNEDGTIAYDAQGGYEQQAFDAPQEHQDYDYANYAGTQEMDSSNTAFADTTLPTEQPNTQAPSNLEATADPAPAAVTAAPAATSSKPTSILSSAEKHAAANDAQKKKKRVNFVDSSETDDSSSVKQSAPHNTGAGSESDFDFSSSEKSGGNGGA